MLLPFLICRKFSEKTPYLSLTLIFANGLGYELLRDLAIKYASTHQTENPLGFSEVG